MRTTLTWPNLLVVLAGIFLLAVSAWQAWRVMAFLSHAERTDGLIVDASPHPRIRFSTLDGKAIEFVQNGFVQRPLNAPIPVAYTPAAPQASATAATFWPLWGGALWPLILGIGFVVLPLNGAIFGPSGRWR